MSRIVSGPLRPFAAVGEIIARWFDDLVAANPEWAGQVDPRKRYGYVATLTEAGVAKLDAANRPGAFQALRGPALSFTERSYEEAATFYCLYIANLAGVIFTADDFKLYEQD